MSQHEIRKIRVWEEALAMVVGADDAAIPNKVK
jgi:hypothetical protein